MAFAIKAQIGDPAGEDNRLRGAGRHGLIAQGIVTSAKAIPRKPGIASRRRG
jgi:hypothetical protein